MSLSSYKRWKKCASAGNRTRAARVAGEHSTTEPPMLTYMVDANTDHSAIIYVNVIRHTLTCSLSMAFIISVYIVDRCCHANEYNYIKRSWFGFHTRTKLYMYKLSERWEPIRLVLWTGWWDVIELHHDGRPSSDPWYISKLCLVIFLARSFIVLTTD